MTKKEYDLKCIAYMLKEGDCVTIHCTKNRCSKLFKHYELARISCPLYNPDETCPSSSEERYGMIHQWMTDNNITKEDLIEYLL